MDKDVKFYAWLTQTGEGCDYTIGCGQVVRPLKAQTLDDAVREVRLNLSDYDNETGDCGEWHGYYYDRICIFSTEGMYEVPIASWQLDAKRAAELRNEQQEQAEKLAQYQRLKAEFGDD